MMRPENPADTAAASRLRTATPVRRRLWLVGVALTLAAGSAQAQCSVSATGLEFASYDVFDAAHSDSTATLTVTCSDATEYGLALSSAHGTSQQPMLSGGDGSLDYLLHQDAARSMPWGEGPYALSGSTASAARHTVYGRIEAGQNVRAGHYADTITVTLTF